MTVLLRLVKILLLLVLTVVAIMLVIGLSGGQTGAPEKVVLVAMLAGCVVLAARLPGWVDAVSGRLHRTHPTV